MREVVFEDRSSLRFIDSQAFDKTYKLKKISLPRSLELIGSRSFWLSGVEEVVLNGVRNLRIDRWAFYRSNLKSIDLPKDVGIHADTFRRTGCSDDSIFVPGATIRDCNPNMVRVHKKKYWSTGNNYWNDIRVSFKLAPGNPSQNPFIGIYPPNTITDTIGPLQEPLRKILFKEGTKDGTGIIPLHPVLEGKENYEAYLLNEDYFILAGPSIFTIQDEERDDDADDDW